jgi:transposase
MAGSELYSGTTETRFANDLQDVVAWITTADAGEPRAVRDSQVQSAVPRVLVWDGEFAIGRWRAGKPELTDGCQAFRGTLGTRVVVCKPADPKAKGLIERCHDHLERSFLPGRTFACPADFNAQLTGWLTVVTPAGGGRWAAPRPTGSPRTGRRCSRCPVAPATGWRSSGRLARDHYVRLDANDYSVHPAVIGRRIEVIAGLDRVRVLCGGRVMADHERCWARHQTMTDPDHLAAARAMRHERVGVLRPAP